MTTCSGFTKYIFKHALGIDLPRTSKEQSTVGTTINQSELKVGDLVCFNPSRYAIKQHQAGSMKDGVIQDNPVVKYNFNIIEVDGKQCLVVDNNDITFVIEEWEEVEEKKSDLIIPDNSLII